MSLNISRIKLLCFDVDGTLADTDDEMVHKLASRLTFIKRVFPSWNEQTFTRRVIMGIETPANLVFNLPDHLGLDDEIVWLIQRFNRMGIGKRKPPFWLINGVLPMLDALALHYPMAVVSARDENGTRAFLDHFSLAPRFQSIITGQTCPHTKPYPDPIFEAARLAGVRPDACLMIGDTTVDILSARRAGAQSIGVLCGFGQENELSKAGADLILPQTAMLSDLLLGS